jgi:hypothetical protein
MLESIQSMVTSDEAVLTVSIVGTIIGGFFVLGILAYIFDAVASIFVDHGE